MANVLIIGAGAAGLMAGISASDNGHKVTILEKNEKAGKKIYITGKGRCNLTNDAETIDFFQSVVRNPKFLFSSVYSFDHDAVKELMEENGCPVKTERGARVFPVSDHASDVTAALLNALKRRGVKIRYNTEVKDLLVSDDRVTGVKLKDGSSVMADHVIVCTGGCSYTSTGSTGDGYRFARKLALDVIEPAPSLVPFETMEKWPGTLSGLSLKNVSVRVYSKEETKKKKKPLYEGFGEMLFTHFGVSGPLILSASSYCDFRKYPEGFILHLDTKPAIPMDELIDRVAGLAEGAPAQQFCNVVKPLLPARFSEAIAELLPFDAKVPARQITDKEIRTYCELLKDIPLSIAKTRGFAEAIVTMGGVSVKEIDPSTMMARKIKGLSFAGEVLDVDGLTGGFNLQIAWSTGHLAGESLTES